MDGRRLVWSGELSEAPLRNERRLLADFIALSEGPSDHLPRRVLDFAQQWGPLGLCEEHHLPMYHGELAGGVKSLAPDHCPPGITGISETQLRELARGANTSGRKRPRTPEEWEQFIGEHPEVLANAEYWEDLSFWEWYSQHARSLLVLAADLRAGRPGHPHDWQAALNQQPLAGEDRNQLLAGRINWWLDVLGRPRLISVWRRGRFSLEIVNGWIAYRPWSGKGATLGVQAGWTGHLFTKLAVAIGSAVAGGTGLVPCKSCGTYFRPKRSTQKYCTHEDCGRKAAVRNAVRRFRQRQKPKGAG